MGSASVTQHDLGIDAEMPRPKRSDWRIGVVGFGGIAQGAHAPGYRDAGWTIAAVVDPDPAAQQAAKEADVERLYASYDELLADDSIDVVDLMTQPTVREEVVVAAAQAGKPLITEKPFGESIQECERMVDAAAQAGVPLAVHQNYRWMRMNFLAHHIVRAGLIGAPFYAAIEIMGAQDEQLATHHFYSVCENFLTIQWNNHLADLLRYWTGADAERVFARTGRMSGQAFRSDNLLLSVADFGEGLTGHIAHTELLRSELAGVRCRVDGDGGSIVFDFNDTMRIDSRGLGGGPRDVVVEGDADYPESFAGSMGDFLCAVETGNEPSVSGRRNLATIRTIMAEHESASAGGAWVECG